MSKFLYIILLIFILYHFPSVVAAPTHENTEKMSKKMEYVFFTEKLIDEVSKYINKYSENSSKLDVEYLIEMCDYYKIDIKFVLAQAQLESQFGTKGLAAKTNSVFNVGAHDDGTILNTYSHPNKSIEPYMLLLKTQYIKQGKTEYDLIKKKQFVNYGGKRYATCPSYEQRLSRIILNIDLETNIGNFDIIRRNTGYIEKYLAMKNSKYLSDHEYLNISFFN